MSAREKLEAVISQIEYLDARADELHRQEQQANERVANAQQPAAEIPTLRRRLRSLAASVFAAGRDPADDADVLAADFEVRRAETEHASNLITLEAAEEFKRGIENERAKISREVQELLAPLNQAQAELAEEILTERVDQYLADVRKLATSYAWVVAAAQTVVSRKVKAGILPAYAIANFIPQFRVPGVSNHPAFPIGIDGVSVDVREALSDVEAEFTKMHPELFR